MSVTLPPRHAGTVGSFGPYRLEERIGRGRTGEVFRAYDTVRERTVALKRLPADVSGDAGYAERFRRASRVAARLSSPHVIPIHDFGTIDGALFLDMALVPGVDLAHELDEHGPLGAARAAAVVLQLADALDAAHADGLVHGDVRPSNVLLSRHSGRDVVHLLDFGLTHQEQEVDASTDVRALGCVLVEALTGRPPFLGEDPAESTGRRRAEPPRVSDRRRGLPAAVDAVVARAMAPSPEDRYATAGELADAVHAALVGASSSLSGGDSTGPFSIPPTAGRSTGGTPAVRYIPAPGGSAAPAWPPTGIPSPRAATSPVGSTSSRRHAASPAPVVSTPVSVPPAPPAPPGTPRRRRTPWWVALGVVLVAVVALAVFAGSDTAIEPTPSPGPPVAAVTAPDGAGRLAAAFPDVAAANGRCAPYATGADEYVTSTGARSLSVVRCDYGTTVLGGFVYYTEWPTAADARRWHDDQATRGPSLGDVTQWSDSAGQQQGPLHTHASADGTVYATAAYTERPYSFDVVTRSLDASRRMFPIMRLLPAAQVPA